MDMKRLGEIMVSLRSLFILQKTFNINNFLISSYHLFSADQGYQILFKCSLKYQVRSTFEE